MNISIEYLNISAGFKADKAEFKEDFSKFKMMKPYSKAHLLECAEIASGKYEEFDEYCIITIPTNRIKRADFK